MIEFGPAITRPRMLATPPPRRSTDPDWRLPVYTHDAALSALDGGLATLSLPADRLETITRGDDNHEEFVGRQLHLRWRSQLPGLRGQLASQQIRAECSEGFAVQMAYAVTSALLERFRQALGRTPDLRPHPQRPQQLRSRYARLRLDVGREAAANAWYDPDDVSIHLCRYDARAFGTRVQIGQQEQTAWSQDVVSHEVAHALLDGLRPHYALRQSLDEAAFHEGFADLVALLSRLGHAAPLERAIAASGDLSHGLITGLGEQFGRTALGSHGPLREVPPLPATAEEARKQYHDRRDPHARGSLLVAAVFDAWRAVWWRCSADLRALLPLAAGAAPRIVARLAALASKLARHFLDLLIRAIDYLPPCDFGFGDLLRAMVSADADLVPEDPHGYREALITAFCRRGLTVEGVDSLSESALRWSAPIARFDVGALRILAQEYSPTEAFSVADRPWSSLLRRRLRASLIAAFLRDNRRCWQQLGLHPVDGGRYSAVTIDSVRALRRRGKTVEHADLVIELSQRRRLGNGLELLGGSTLIVDLSGSIRQVVYKRVDSDHRAARLADFHAHEAHRFGACPSAFFRQLDLC